MMVLIRGTVVFVCDSCLIFLLVEEMILFTRDDPPMSKVGQYY